MSNIKSGLFNYILASAAVILSLTACQKEHAASKKPSHNIVPITETVFKSGSDLQPYGSDARGKLLSQRVVASAEGFDLIEMVYENNAGTYGAGYGTKGSVITTGDLESFNIDAYAEEEWHDNLLPNGSAGSEAQPHEPGLYFSAAAAKSSGAWAIDGEPKWINGIPISFWSYNYVQPVRNGSQISFEYTVPGTVSDQKDLLFAYNNEIRKFNEKGEIQDGKDETFNITFYHALSPVQFVADPDLANYRISAVEIQNVNSKTVCEISTAGGTPTFSHTSSELASFSQTYGSTDPSLAIPADYETSPKGMFKEDDSKTFIMVPQSFGTAKGSKLKVTFEYTGGGTSGETTSPVFEFSGTWEAGKYYVYKIDLKGNIHVDISETCTDTGKSDVKFQNTSNVNEYIRAAVTANWYIDGDIVSGWDRTRDGDFTLGSGWSLESDGFYYHAAPVATQGFTSNLFDSFTKPTTAPVADAHFEMTILVQATASDGISSCVAAFTPAS